MNRRLRIVAIGSKYVERKLCGGRRKVLGTLSQQWLCYHYDAGFGPRDSLDPLARCACLCAKYISLLTLHLISSFLGGSKPKIKKTKEERAGPRRRKKKKKQQGLNEQDFDDSDSEFNLDTSDLLEKKSQGSNNSSQPRRNRSSWASKMSAEPSNCNLDSSNWLGGLLGQSQSSQFNVVDGIFTPPRRRTTSREQAESSDTWLDLQAEWIFSKQHMIDVEYALEAAERKKWSEWAVHAAEIERKRRIQIMDELDKAEIHERQRRQKWAISAIEKERNERISTQFLTNLTATNWFNETISSFNLQNYDVVCPYYKLGCRFVCRKIDIQKHMKSCPFALEVPDRSEKIIATDYEVVCPNCVLGCTFIGRRKKLHEHLTESCAYKGKSRQEENDERQLLKEIVIPSISLSHSLCLSPTHTLSLPHTLSVSLSPSLNLSPSTSLY
jgi:hypothetical protein